MKDYNKNKKSSDIQYWDENNLYGWEQYKIKSSRTVFIGEQGKIKKPLP